MAFAYNSAPAPVVKLNNHCSVIYNTDGVDTLYTFQQDAFQSLPLKSGATWSKLPMGTAVNGAKCVLGQWNHQDALIVVGGTGVSGTPADYPGLQYYTFSSKAWAQIPTGSWPTSNRQMHSAVFLNSSNSLLLYSGFQDNSNKVSSETFTITAEPPYQVDSHPAATVPVQNPILLPWNASHAVTTGGSASNHAVWLFSKEQGWEEIGVQANAVPDMTQVSAAILDGINDAKAIQFFNLAAVPNTVTNVIVQAADGSPHTKREVDVNALPQYNDTNASKTNRVGYSLAQSRSNGMIVGSGGAGDQAAPIVLFNPSANSWLAPQDFFGIKSNNNLQSVLGSSSSTSSSSTSTASSTTSTTSATTTSSSTSASSTASVIASAALPTNTVATGGDGLSDNSRVILGGVLGGLAGLAALSIVALLCFRWKKQKRRIHAHDYHMESKNQMGFDDRDAVARFNRSGSQTSESSYKSSTERTPTAQEKLGVTISKPNLIFDSSSPLGGSNGLREPLIASTLPPTTVGGKNDDGWNQYFSKSPSSTSALTPPPATAGRPRLDSVTRQTTFTLSNYNIESHTAEIYDHDTAPLNPRSSGYPQSQESWEQSNLHPQRGHNRGPSSNYASTISEGDDPETFLHSSSGASGTQAWDSLSPNDGQGSFNRRPTSSMYTDSLIYHHPGDKVHVPEVSDTSLATAATKGSQVSDGRGMRSMVTRDFGTSSSAALGGGSSKKDDMSWLNLGKS